MSANERQVGGDHYRGKAIQPWDAMRAWLGRRGLEAYLRGNLIKYTARYPDKGGDVDLAKAGHYLQKLQELRAEPQDVEDLVATVRECLGELLRPVPDIAGRPALVQVLRGFKEWDAARRGVAPAPASAGELLKASQSALADVAGLRQFDFAPFHPPERTEQPLEAHGHALSDAIARISATQADMERITTKTAELAAGMAAAIAVAEATTGTAGDVAPPAQGIAVEGLDSLEMGRYATPSGDLIELCGNPQFQLFASKQRVSDGSEEENAVVVAAQFASQQTGKEFAAITEQDYLEKLFQPFQAWLAQGMP